MATDPSIKVVKSFNYRGTTRLWSNRYHFDNLVPADNTKWTTFSDAITAAEKVIYQSNCTIVATYGYDAGSDVPVFSKTYSLAGTGSFASYSYLPGDSCALCRWSTGARSTKNHAIYLFSYWHSVYGTTPEGAAAADTVNAAQLTAMQTYANSWVTGFSDGAITHHRCGPNGHVGTAALVSSTIHHRDFPRG